MAKMAARSSMAGHLERAIHHYFMAWDYFRRGEAATAVHHAGT